MRSLFPILLLLPPAAVVAGCFDWAVGARDDVDPGRDTGVLDGPSETGPSLDASDATTADAAIDGDADAAAIERFSCPPPAGGPMYTCISGQELCCGGINFACTSLAGCAERLKLGCTRSRDCPGTQVCCFTSTAGGPSPPAGPSTCAPTCAAGAILCDDPLDCRGLFAQCKADPQGASPTSICSN